MKKLLAALSLCAVLVLFGGFTMDELRYKRVELTGNAGKGPYGIQVDDLETMGRIDTVMREVWSHPLMDAPDEQLREEIVLLGDLDLMTERIAFLSDRANVKIGDSYYSCTEAQFAEMEAIMKEGTAQERQAFWRLLEAGENVFEPMLVAQGFCPSDSAAVEKLTELLDAQPKIDAPEAYEINGEYIALDLYWNGHLTYLYITPDWIQVRTDYDLYYKSTPETYETIKEIIGAQDLTFAYPKTLEVKLSYGSTPVKVTDPARIRALLEPLQNARITEITGPSCGMGTIVLYLDGEEYLSVQSGEVYASSTEKSYTITGDMTGWKAKAYLSPGTREYV